MQPRLARLLLATAFGLAAMALLPQAAAAPPPDAFCVIVIEADDGFRTVRVIVDEETTIEERGELWPSVDVDGDGSITPAEAEAFRVANLQLLPRQDGIGAKATVLESASDGGRRTHGPLYAAFWRQVGHTFHQRDYRLPDVLTDVADLETQEVREYRYDIHAVPQEVVLRGGDELGRLLDPRIAPPTPPTPTEPRVVVEYVVVRAPPGWLVASVEGWAYDAPVRLEPHARSVDIPALDTSKPWTVRYVPEGEDGRGAGSLPSLALVAALALAVASRRRA
ncbi:MAG TPA: hypothetical protein VFH47_03290 [Candidatus Thermoplasmatota archaeon]|nr:hypothetical protein [Candidatus Thermoplasmatota archaeon]